MTQGEYLEVGRRADGSLLWRTWIMHWIGKRVGILFHIGGWPYGASHDRAVNAWRPRDTFVDGESQV